MRRRKYSPLEHQLLKIKIDMEREKLAQLRGVRNKDGSHVETFLHYEDLPPLPPEDKERLAVRHKTMMRNLYKREKAKMAIEPHDVNPVTHCQITGEPIDYSEVEAKYGPYHRPDKPPVTVTLRPSCRDVEG